MDLTDDELMQFVAANIDELERELGYELGEDERQAVFEAAVNEAFETGHINVREHLDDLLGPEREWQHRFDSGVTEVENKLGRRLTDGERRRLFEAAPDDDPKLVSTFDALRKPGDSFDGSKSGRVAHAMDVADEVYEAAGVDSQTEAEDDDGVEWFEVGDHDINDVGERRSAAMAAADAAYADSEPGEAG